MTQTAGDSLLNMIMEVLEQSGYSREALFRDSGVSYALLDLNLLQLPQLIRVYQQALGTLERVLCKMEQRTEIVGKKASEMLLMYVIHAADLRTAFNMIGDFYDILGGKRGKSTLNVGKEACFDMDSEHETQHPASYLLMQAGLISHYGLVSWLIGENLPITSIHLGCPEEYEYVTRGVMLAPVSYDCGTYGFTFDLHWLDAPVIRTPGEMATALPLFPFDLMLSQTLSERFGRRVRLLIVSMLGRGQQLPSVADIAALFNMSESTFRRRCREEGINFQQIKDQSLKEMACEWLRNTNYDVEEIALKLGFGEARSFRRAFKRWTGKVPSKYRG